MTGVLLPMLPRDKDRGSILNMLIPPSLVKNISEEKGKKNIFFVTDRVLLKTFFIFLWVFLSSFMFICLSDRQFICLLPDCQFVCCLIVNLSVA